MSRTLTIQLDDETYRLFDAAAKAENRPLASFIERSVLARIRDQHTASAAASEASQLQRAVDEAEEGLARGRWVEHRQVAAKLRRWASGEA
jgi:predicted transcriptional regulator